MSLSRNRFRRLTLSLTSFILLACTGIAEAQLGAVPRESRIPEEFLRGPHVGTVEQALVGIEVVNISTDGAVRQSRYGSGIVLRCDGFVLAPTALFEPSVTVAGRAENAGSQAVSVILNPGTPAEKRIKARPPRFKARDMSYAAFKMDGVHTPAARALLPDAIKPGDPLRVVWTSFDPTTKQFQKAAGMEARLGKGDPETEKDRPGYIPFEAPLANVPAGAVVVGPDGTAVGLVTGSGVQAQCAGAVLFGVLHRATNCITALSAPPRPPAIEGDGAAAGGASPMEAPMVLVPGGPIVLPVGVAIEQPDMEGAGVACIAPFEIDKFEVTNKEYLAFWQSLPVADRNKLWFQNRYYPATWSKSGAPFPGELENHPVIGVPLPGAMEYARSHGKRLPTPYEWALAAFGPKGEGAPPEWMGQYLEDRRTVWRKLTERHEQYLSAHRELLQNGVDRDFFALPWLARTADWMQASKWSRQTLEQLTDPLWGMWRRLPYLLPVGSREFDTSPYGASDMMANARELVLPNPGPPAAGNSRAMTIDWLPVRPKPTDEWTVRKVELLAGELGLQPMSRLYHRALMSPEIEDIAAWSSMHEALSMASPLASWQLRMAPELTVTAAGYVRQRNAFDALTRRMGLQIWDGLPKYYQLEMGLPVPLDRKDQHVSTGPQLTYYLPLGFRCAR